MDIRDAMAEAILRDVLANPGKYPSGLAARATMVNGIQNPNGNYGGPMSDGWPLTTRKWMEYLAEYRLTVLPDESPDQKPEGDGNQCPDARNFENKE